MIEMGVLNMKFTLKEKLHYVKLHVEENVPIYEIERKYGISANSIKYFCRLYKIHGEKALNFVIEDLGYQKEKILHTPLHLNEKHLIFI